MTALRAALELSPEPRSGSRRRQMLPSLSKQEALQGYLRVDSAPHARVLEQRLHRGRIRG